VTTDRAGREGCRHDSDSLGQTRGMSTLSSMKGSRERKAPTRSAEQTRDADGQLTVHVAVRVRAKVGHSSRPAIEAEPTKGSLRVGIGDGDSTVLHFERVFGPDDSQAMVYQNSCLGMAQDVALGQTACVLVGGPKGSGKHFTLVGQLGNFGEMGVAPRLAADILEKVESMRSDAATCKMGIYQVGSLV
jgi:hypothetical protein